MPACVDAATCDGAPRRAANPLVSASFIRRNGIRLSAALRSAALAAVAGFAGGCAGVGTLSSLITKLPLAVPVLVTVSARLCEPPGLIESDRGRGAAASKPASSAKSRRVEEFGITVLFFVEDSCAGKAASKEFAPLSENRM